MRSAPAGQLVSTGYQNGRVLQMFQGTATASPVSFNATLTATGYPVNSPFVKLRPESLLDIVVECDWNGPHVVPDTIWIYLYVDGSLIEGLAHAATTADTEYSTLIVVNRLALAAGSHTVEVKASDNANQTCSILTNGSCDFTIIEYV